MGTVCSKIRKVLCGRGDITIRITSLEELSDKIDGKIKFLDLLVLNLEKIKKKQREGIKVLHEKELDKFLKLIKQTKQEIKKKSKNFEVKFTEAKIDPTKINIDFVELAYRNFEEEMEKSHVQKDLKKIEKHLQKKIADANSVGFCFHPRFKASSIIK